MRKLLIESDFLTNGLIVNSVRMVTVKGYVRHMIVGHARELSFDTLMSLVTSCVPCSSVYWMPAVVAVTSQSVLLELAREGMDLHSSEGDALISMFKLELLLEQEGNHSQPILNISLTSPSTPWFFKLRAGQVMGLQVE